MESCSRSLKASGKEMMKIIVLIMANFYENKIK